MIKKLLSLVFLFFFLFGGGYAQLPDAKKIHFSLKGGLNLSGFTDNVGVFDKQSKTYAVSQYTFYENYFRITGSIGIAGDYQLSKSMSIAAELVYNGRGAAYRQQNGNVVILGGSNGVEKAYDYYKFQIDYLELPVLVQYNLGAALKKSSYVIYGGIAPSITIKTGTNYSYYTSNGNSPVDASSASKSGGLEQVRAFNLSPIAGFQIGSNRDAPTQFFVDFRFEYTLLPVFNVENIDGYNFKTNMWTGGFGIGVRF